MFYRYALPFSRHLQLSDSSPLLDVCHSLCHSLVEQPSLLKACKEGDLNAVRGYLEQGSTDINAREDDEV